MADKSGVEASCGIDPTSMPNVPTPIRYLPTITDHIKKYFGADFFVLHEKKSSTVHIDVHVVRPTATRPYFTLLTSGMSDLDMRVPMGLAANWMLGGVRARSFFDFGFRQTLARLFGYLRIDYRLILLRAKDTAGWEGNCGGRRGRALGSDANMCGFPTCQELADCKRTEQATTCGPKPAIQSSRRLRDSRMCTRGYLCERRIGL